MQLVPTLTLLIGENPGFSKMLGGGIYSSPCHLWTPSVWDSFYHIKISNTFYCKQSHIGYHPDSFFPLNPLAESMEAVGFDLHEGAESICIVVPQRTLIDNDITPIFKCPSTLPKGCPEVSSLASSLHKLQSLPSSLSLPTFSLSLRCLLLLQNRGSWCTGSVVVVHGFSCPEAWDLSSQTRDQTCVPSTSRQILNHWTIRESQGKNCFFPKHFYISGTILSTLLVTIHLTYITVLWQ